MPAAFRQTHGFSDGSSAGNVADTYAAPVLAGSLLWCAVGAGNVTVSGVSDSVNGAWTQAVSVLNPDFSSRLDIWYRENSGAGTPTVTATLSAGSAGRTIILHEVTGIATASARDKTASASGNDAAPNSGSQTPTTDGQYIAGFIMHDPVRTVITPGAFTFRDNSVTDAGLTTLDQVQGAAASVAVAAALDPSGAVWSALMATFKAAAGGGGDLSVSSIGEPVVGGSTF